MTKLLNRLFVFFVLGWGPSLWAGGPISIQSTGTAVTINTSIYQAVVSKNNDGLTSLIINNDGTNLLHATDGGFGFVIGGDNSNSPTSYTVSILDSGMARARVQVLYSFAPGSVTQVFTFYESTFVFTQSASGFSGNQDQTYSILRTSQSSITVRNAADLGGTTYDNSGNTTASLPMTWNSFQFPSSGSRHILMALGENNLSAFSFDVDMTTSIRRPGQFSRNNSAVPSGTIFTSRFHLRTTNAASYGGAFYSDYTNPANPAGGTFVVQQGLYQFSGASASFNFNGSSTNRFFPVFSLTGWGAQGLPDYITVDGQPKALLFDYTANLFSGTLYLAYFHHVRNNAAFVIGNQPLADPVVADSANNNGAVTARQINPDQVLVQFRVKTSPGLVRFYYKPSSAGAWIGPIKTNIIGITDTVYHSSTKVDSLIWDVRTAIPNYDSMTDVRIRVLDNYDSTQFGEGISPSFLIDTRLPANVTPAVFGYSGRTLVLGWSGLVEKHLDSVYVRVWGNGYDVTNVFRGNAGRRDTTFWRLGGVAVNNPTYNFSLVARDTIGNRNQFLTGTQTIRIDTLDFSFNKLMDDGNNILSSATITYEFSDSMGGFIGRMTLSPSTVLTDSVLWYHSLLASGHLWGGAQHWGIINPDYPTNTYSNTTRNFYTYVTQAVALGDSSRDGAGGESNNYPGTSPYNLALTYTVYPSGQIYSDLTYNLTSSGEALHHVVKGATAIGTNRYAERDTLIGLSGTSSSILATLYAPYYSLTFDSLATRTAVIGRNGTVATATSQHEYWYLDGGRSTFINYQEVAGAFLHPDSINMLIGLRYTTGPNLGASPNDCFDERRGVYHLQMNPKEAHIKLVFSNTNFVRYTPVFEVHNWSYSDKPTLHDIRFNSTALASADYSYFLNVNSNILYLQVYRNFRGGLDTLEIRGNPYILETSYFSSGDINPASDTLRVVFNIKVADSSIHGSDFFIGALAEDVNRRYAAVRKGSVLNATFLDFGSANDDTVYLLLAASDTMPAHELSYLFFSGANKVYSSYNTPNAYEAGAEAAYQYPGSGNTVTNIPNRMIETFNVWNQTQDRHYRTIEEAENNANPGDTIEVLDNGQYTEVVSVTRSRLFFQPAVGAWPYVRGNLDGFVITSDSVRIEDFNIINSDEAIQVNNTSDSTFLYNNYLNNNTTGISVLGATRVKILSDTLFNNVNYGVYVDQAAATLTIDSGYIVDNDGSSTNSRGVYVLDGNSLIMKNSLSRDNRRGIEINSCPSYRLENVLVDLNITFGVYIRGSSGTTLGRIDSCQVVNNTGSGTYGVQVNNSIAHFDSSVLQGNTDYGLRVTSTTSALAKLLNCHIKSNLDEGLLISGTGTWVRMDSCLVFGNQEGIQISSAGLYLDSCSIFNNTAQGILADNSAKDTLLNTVVYGNTSYGIELNNATLVADFVHVNTNGNGGINAYSGSLVDLDSVRTYSNTGYGIRVATNATLTQVNSRSHNNSSYGVGLDNASGTINRSVVHNNATYGFYINNSAGAVRVNQSESYSNGPGGGVYVSSNGSQSMILDASTIRNNNGYGIRGQTSGKIEIMNSTIYSNSSQGIWIDQAAVKVHENEIYSNYDGITIQGVQTTTAILPYIYRNTIRHNVHNGMTLDGCRRYNIMNNFIKRNGKNGLFALNSLTTDTIFNNLVFKNDSTGIALTSGNANVVKNNLSVYNTVSGVYNNSVRSFDIDYNLTFGNGSTNFSGLARSGNDFSGDPLLADTAFATEDFHLLVFSPAIDGGDPTRWYFRDPDSSRADIGVYGGDSAIMAAPSVLRTLTAAPNGGFYQLTWSPISNVTDFNYYALYHENSVVTFTPSGSNYIGQMTTQGATTFNTSVGVSNLNYFKNNVVDDSNYGGGYVIDDTLRPFIKTAMYFSNGTTRTGNDTLVIVFNEKIIDMGMYKTDPRLDTANARAWVNFTIIGEGSIWQAQSISGEIANDSIVKIVMTGTDTMFAHYRSRITLPSNSVCDYNRNYNRTDTLLVKTYNVFNISADTSYTDIDTASDFSDPNDVLVVLDHGLYDSVTITTADQYIVNANIYGLPVWDTLEDPKIPVINGLNALHAVAIRASGVRFEGFHITNAHKDSAGILAIGNNDTLANNFIFLNKGDGIYANGNNILIANNTAHQNDSIGYYYASGTGGEIVNCVADSNKQNINVPSGGGVTTRYNALSEDSSDYIVSILGPNSNSGGFWVKDVKYFSTDPSIAIIYLNLDSASQANDAGTDLRPAIKKDFYGTLRPWGGTNFDMGAHEFSPPGLEFKLYTFQVITPFKRVDADSVNDSTFQSKIKIVITANTIIITQTGPDTVPLTNYQGRDSVAIELTTQPSRFSFYGSPLLKGPGGRDYGNGTAIFNTDSANIWDDANASCTLEVSSTLSDDSVRVRVFSLAYNKISFASPSLVWFDGRLNHVNIAKFDSNNSMAGDTIDVQMEAYDRFSNLIDRKSEAVKQTFHFNIKVTQADTISNLGWVGPDVKGLMTGDSIRIHFNDGIGNLGLFYRVSEDTLVFSVYDSAGSKTGKDSLYADTIAFWRDNILNIVNIEYGTSGRNDQAGLVQDTFTVLDTIIVHASGYDTFHNYIGDIRVTWDQVGTLDTLPYYGFGNKSGAYIFGSMSAPVSGRLTAVADTLSRSYRDTSGIIMVLHGPLHHYSIAFNLGVLEVGHPYQMQLTARDTFDNVVDSNFLSPTAVFDVVTFATSVDSLRRFDYIPMGTELRNESADHDSALVHFSDGVGNFEVNYTIAHDTAVINFHDVAHNLVLDTSLVWIPAPLSIIQIQYGLSGNQINRGEVDTFLTILQSLPLHVAGYDSFGNYIQDIKVDWDTTQTFGNPFFAGNQPLLRSGLPSQDVSAYTFTFGQSPCSLKVTAVFRDAIVLKDTLYDTTSWIRILPGPFHHFRVVVNNIGVKVNQPISVIQTPLDTFNNVVYAPTHLFPVSIDGSMQIFDDSSHKFFITAQGQDSIKANTFSSPGLADTAFIIKFRDGQGQYLFNHLIAGSPTTYYLTVNFWNQTGQIIDTSVNVWWSPTDSAYIKVEYDSAGARSFKGKVEDTITVLQNLTMHASLYDTFANWIKNVSVEWHATASLEINARNPFGLRTVAYVFGSNKSEISGRINATLFGTTENMRDTTRLIAVINGPWYATTITLSQPRLTTYVAGDTVRATVTAVDTFNNRIIVWDLSKYTLTNNLTVRQSNANEPIRLGYYNGLNTLLTNGLSAVTLPFDSGTVKLGMHYTVSEDPVQFRFFHPRNPEAVLVDSVNLSQTIRWLDNEFHHLVIGYTHLSDDTTGNNFIRLVFTDSLGMFTAAYDTFDNFITNVAALWDTVLIDNQATLFPLSAFAFPVSAVVHYTFRDSTVGHFGWIKADYQGLFYNNYFDSNFTAFRSGVSYVEADTTPQIIIFNSYAKYYTLDFTERISDTQKKIITQTRTLRYFGIKVSAVDLGFNLVPQFAGERTVRCSVWAYDGFGKTFLTAPDFDAEIQDTSEFWTLPYQNNLITFSKGEFPADDVFRMTNITRYIIKINDMRNQGGKEYDSIISMDIPGQGVFHDTIYFWAEETIIVKDGTGPILRSAETHDQNADGFLDLLTLHYNEVLKDTLVHGDSVGFELIPTFPIPLVSEFEIDSVRSIGKDSLVRLYVDHQAGGTMNTEDRPRVRYAFFKGNSVFDSAGNEAIDRAIDSSKVRDWAGPVIERAQINDRDDYDRKNDLLIITFSEDINRSEFAGGDSSFLYFNLKRATAPQIPLNNYFVYDSVGLPTNKMIITPGTVDTLTVRLLPFTDSLNINILARITGQNKFVKDISSSANLPFFNNRFRVIEYINQGTVFDNFISTPNPVRIGGNNTGTTFRVKLFENVDIDLSIYDLAGGLVWEGQIYQADKSNLYFTGREVTYVWNGANLNKRYVTNGAYICVLRAKDQTQTWALGVIR